MLVFKDEPSASSTTPPETVKKEIDEQEGSKKSQNQKEPEIKPKSVLLQENIQSNSSKKTDEKSLANKEKVESKSEVCNK